MGMCGCATIDDVRAATVDTVSPLLAMMPAAGDFR